MKLVLTLVLIAISTISWAQTGQEKVVDSIFLSRINQYRAQHGLHNISFCDKADSLSRSHNKYMLESNKITHVEIIGKDTIKPNQRISDSNRFGLENVAGGGIPEKILIEKSVYQVQKELNESNKLVIDFFINLTMEEWENSPLHNKNLLDKNINKGAVSIKFDFKKSKFVADFIAYN